MEAIDAILFEPVGALAEFPGGSQVYWDRVEARTLIETDEMQAVEQAVIYDDAAPALAELAGLGVRLIAATSLSEAALTRFLERASLQHLFHDRWSRDRAGGVAQAVLMQAVAAGSFSPDRVMFLADTASGLRAAKQAGVNAILMMNDPDEAMRLTALDPAGGIVSLHELPDFVRLLAAQQT